MSKIIKASRITGEYKLDDMEIISEKSSLSMTETESDELVDSDNQPEKELSRKPEKKIQKANKKAKAIIEKAEQQAEKIIYKAEQESEKLKEEAYNEAYKKGLEEGKKEGYEDKVSQLGETINNLKKIKEKFTEEIQQEKQKLPEKVINLAVMIAQKIVNTRLKIQPELINDIVKGMLENMIKGFNEIKIKVVPELIQTLNQDELEKIKYDADIEIIPDSNLEKGDCIIETDYGGKDGTLENKLKLIKKQLLKE